MLGAAILYHAVSQCVFMLTFVMPSVVIPSAVMSSVTAPWPAKGVLPEKEEKFKLEFSQMSKRKYYLFLSSGWCYKTSLYVSYEQAN